MVYSLSNLSFFLGAETLRVKSANQKTPYKWRHTTDTYPRHLPSLSFSLTYYNLCGRSRHKHMFENMASCSVPGCCVTAVKQSFHSLPVDKRDQWLNFIYKDRVIPSVLSPRLRVCSSHFVDDCFTNLVQVNMGFAKRKILKTGAVPTIYPGDTESSTSGVLPVS